MKKLVNFIIDKRLFILTLFIVGALTCVYLSTKVNINYEISNYLPKSSEVKKGLDIMNDEFKVDSSSFYIMFDDLEKKEKELIYNELNNFNGVLSVDYDDTENYNVKNHTLYKVNVDGDVDSKKASKTYKEILKKYTNKDIETTGEVADRNTEVLPKYVLVGAILFGTIILIVMCDSVVEVFLFLFTILMAVLFNKGTNIMFNSVSNITDSISAILQLALSMDYSIMLMNRFNQAKVKEKNITKAMKDALYNSFLSVSSSSVTTVVGLIALVFMSFTIGRDLGFVLAKGVVCSLISTFFVLPGLILIFNKGIEKTKKKVPRIRMDRLSKISYRFRFISLIIFLAIFVGSYILKGNVNIIFLEGSQNNISTIFKEENEIAIIYNNKDEIRIKEICKKLSDDERLNSVLCYSNTINDKLKYSEMNNKLSELGTNTNIEDYLLKLVYYKYHNDENNKIDFNSLIKFINNVVYKNKDYEIDNETKNYVTTLSYFTSKDSINKRRSVKDISNIINIDESLLTKLLILYNSQDTAYKISLKDFINFMNNNVINNKDFAISSEVSSKIKMLYSIINNVDNKLSSSELSKTLGIGKDNIDQIILLYLNSNDINTKLNINEFTNILIDNYDSYKDKIDEELYKEILLLNKISNTNFINQDLSQVEMNSIYNLDISDVNSIYSFLGKEKVSIIEFNNILLNSGSITDVAILNKLNLLKNVMDNVDNRFDYGEISSIINLDPTLTKLIYVLHDYKDYKISIKNFIYFIVDNNLVNDKSITSLYSIIKNLDNKFNYKDMSKFMETNSSDLSLIYGLYSYTKGNNSISLNSLIKFICKNVINNKDYSSNFNEDSKNKLLGIEKIINYVEKDKKLSSKEMIGILSLLDKNLDSSMIDVLYLYYGSYYNYDENYAMTIEELISYLNDNILNDKRFDKYIKDDMRSKIIDAKKDIVDAKNMLVGDKYSRMIITSNMSEEGKDIRSFVNDLNKDLKETDSYVIGNSPMAIEMDKSFDGELNLITILTMIFIFVVVAITFKSNIISLVLVLIIQCAVFITMGILSLLGTKVYFISLLVVQAVLMGATIDYAIVYTSYYMENRKKMGIKESIYNAYSNSIHTILTSSLILCSCTLVVALLTNAACAKICKTITEGAFCSTLLIVFILPGILASIDRFISKKKRIK